jgi:hypothetical protein
VNASSIWKMAGQESAIVMMKPMLDTRTAEDTLF